MIAWVASGAALLLAELITWRALRRRREPSVWAGYDDEPGDWITLP